MILYFSATGNTRFIAQELARRLDDEALDLTARIREGDHAPIQSQKPFVICSPVYVCEPPRLDRKSTRLNSSHKHRSRMPSSA